MSIAQIQQKVVVNLKEHINVYKKIEHINNNFFLKKILVDILKKLSNHVHCDNMALNLSILFFGRLNCNIYNLLNLNNLVIKSYL